MSNITIYIKKLLAVPLYYGVNNFKLLNKYNIQKEYLVLMYHRIIKKKESISYMQDGMYVDPDAFRMQILFLKSKFNIVPLESVLSTRNTKNKFENKKPYCIITFDDGWIDFYRNAYPILKYHQVCSTVFLTTDFIGSNALFWTDKLALIMEYGKRSNYRDNVNNKILSSDDIIKQVENIQGPMDIKIEKSIQILKYLPAKDIENVLEQLAYKWHVNLDTKGPSFLSWEEIKEMHDSGVVFFGSHTKSHQILTTSSDDVIRQELVQSKNKLVEMNVVSPSFIPFAYPNGNYTRKIANMVGEAGYSIAVTTEKGWNRFDGDSTDMYKLKRIGIHQDIASTDSMLACRIFGLY